MLPVRIRLDVARTATALALLAAAALPAQGQFLKRIKDKIAEHTIQKIAEHGAKAESTVVNATDKATDSALTKTNRGLDTTVAKAGVVADTGLNRTERGVKALFSANRGSREQMVASLAARERAVIADSVFAPSSAQLLPAADETLRKLAAAMAATEGAFLIEGHVDATADANVDRQLSEDRAAAVKARLITLGIAEGRLFVMGYGGTRPLPGSAHSARIEIARMK